MQTVVGNDPAPVRLSSRDTNHIIAPANIVKIFTSKLNPERDKNAVQIQGADAFIQIPPHHSGPIELFIATEAGTYALMGLPAPIPAETIKIVGAEEKPPTLALHPYIRQLKSLIRAAEGPTPPDGYEEVPILNAKDECPYMECTLIAEKRYVGRQLTITKYRLSNPTRTDQIYMEEYFLGFQRAVSIEGHLLSPGGSTQMIVIEDTPPSLPKTSQEKTP